MRCLLIVLALLLQVVCYAQEPAMRHLTVEDGLPSATIYQTLQDKDGFLWFCTDVGVARFDGREFTKFSINDGLSDDEILNMFLDSKGRVWFLGFNGELSYYLRGRIFNAASDTMLGSAKGRGPFVTAFEDSHHRLWFSCEQGCYLIEGRQMRFLNKPLSGDVVMMNSKISDGLCVMSGWADRSRIYIESRGSFKNYKPKYVKKTKSASYSLPGGGALFVAEQGIVYMQDTAQRLLFYFADTSERLLEYAVMMASDSNIWVATMGDGVYCYSLKDRSIPVRHCLRNKVAGSAFEDHEHNIWIGTLGDGVYMLPSWYANVKSFTSSEGLETNQVTCVTKKANGDVYAGLNNGALDIINADGVHPFRYQKSDVKRNRITQIVFEQEDCWVGSDKDLQYIRGPENRAEPACFRTPDDTTRRLLFTVKGILADNRGLVVASSVGAFASEPRSAGRRNIVFRQVQDVRDRCYAITRDRSGVIWYSTPKGLFSNDGHDHYHGYEDPLLRTRICSMAPAEDGVLLLATAGYGLLFYKDGSVRYRLTEKDGLSSNVCRRVRLHGKEVFISTPEGASRFQYSEGKAGPIRRYTTADGLLSNDVNDTYADDSEICFATSSGVSILGIKTPEIKPSEPPPLFINEITCDGKNLQKDSLYQLPYNQRSFYFSYIAPAYQLPEEVNYQYRIRPEQPWTATKSNSLNFPFLPPGNYYFQIRARIKNGPWSEVKSFSFTIRRPYWETAWFMALVLLAAATAAILFYRWRLEAARGKRLAKLKLQNQIMHLEQQAMQAMMNPHFIFNVMNSIQHFINANDRHAANLYLSDFARLIRLNMDIASKSVISLDEELIYLKLYLSLESLRFGKSLTYDIEVDEEIDGDETMVPVMMLQPFLENAIWHGVMPLKHAGHIRLVIQKAGNDQILIRITDNGVGISSPGITHPQGSPHQSMGIKLTQQRLDLIGKMNGQSLYVRIVDRKTQGDENGTLVELTLPAGLQF